MISRQIIWFKENIGSCLSWAITIGWLIFIYFKIHDGNIPTDLNEFGDFVAGSFAPLAFFWLVRGFYQQGKGLAQNSSALKMQAVELARTTEALELQVQEMRASVQQQSRLAKIYEEEMQQKHFQAQPYFEYSFKITKNYITDEVVCDEDDNFVNSYKERHLEFNLTIQNLGELARNFIIKSRKEQPYLQKRKYKFEHLESLVIILDVEGQLAEELLEGKYDLVRLFKLNYQDAYGKKYEQFISCNVITRIDAETDEIHLDENCQIISKEDALVE